MTIGAGIGARIHGRYQRTLSRAFFKQPVAMRNAAPVISFTFDDFPRSALHTGGAILRQSGLAGTYYAALGLMGQQAPTGRMFVEDDLTAVLAQGHELGCHTFAHCDAWETEPSTFEASIVENRGALLALMPDFRWRTFSYPLTPPRPLNKLRAASHFACMRGCGQIFNAGVADLNNLFSYFLEQARGR